MLALRHALRDTQEQFAERVGCSVESVGKWEQRMRPTTPSAKYAECLDTILSRLAPEQLGRFRNALEQHGYGELHDTNTVPPAAGTIIAATGGDRSPEAGDDVDRRQFGTAVVGAAAMAAIPATRRIGVGDARRVNELVDDFITRDQSAGGASVLSDAVGALNRANTMLNTCSFESTASEDAFTVAVGKLAIRVGWLAYDTRNHELARSCYAEALALANVAGDDQLTIHGCANSAMLAVNAGSPRRARRFAARATDLTHRMPPGRIHALLAVREANAHAALGDTSAFGRSIASAWREMDRAVDHESLDECLSWLRFMSHAEVLLHEAIGHKLLGHPERAVELYGQATSRYSATPRNAANYRASLAGAFASVGDLHNAETEGSAALDQLAEGIASPRALHLLDPVRDLLRDHPGSDSFTDHYDDLARQMEALTA